MAATWAGHFVDGFDHALAADTPKKYFSGVAGSQVATANTRFSRGYAVASGEREFNAGGNYQTWRFAGAIYRGGSDTDNFLQFRDSGGNQLYIELTAAGNLVVHNGDTTVLGTAVGVIPADTWLWVEFIIYIHGSAGVVLVFVSNTVTPVLSLTGVDTQNTANAYGQVCYHRGNSSSFKWDDVHISWGSGSPVAGDALPDSTVVTDHAVTQGAHSDFTPDSGTNHVDRVRDATAGTLADGDSTYLSSNTAGNKESMLFDDLPVDVTDIYLVQITAEVRKNDAAARTVKLGTRRSGTDTEQASATNATDTYQFKTFAQTLDPQTSATWTRANVNATEGLVDLVS